MPWVSVRLTTAAGSGEFRGANHECPGKKKDMKVSVAERIKELERNIGKKQKNEWLEVD